MDKKTDAALKTATKWDRIKVIVMGLSIIGSTLLFAYTSGSKLSEIYSGVETLRRDVTEFRSDFEERHEKLEARLTDTDKTLSQHSSRLIALEVLDRSREKFDHVLWSTISNLTSRVERFYEEFRETVDNLRRTTTPR